MKKALDIVSGNPRVDNARKLLGDYYLSMDELEAVVAFWDKKIGKDAELNESHIQGWKSARFADELLGKELSEEEFAVLEDSIREKLDWKFDYTSEAEALFMEYAEKNFHIIHMRRPEYNGAGFGLIWFIPYVLYHAKD